MSKKVGIISVLSIALLVIGLAIILTIAYKAYHPKEIVEGSNKFSLGSYDIEKSGLSGLEKIVKKTKDLANAYSIGHFEATVDQKGIVKSFTLSLDTFDSNNEYTGMAGYVYSSDKLVYTKPQIVTDMLVNKLNVNSTFTYLDEQIRKIPFKEQIKLSGLDRYVIRYQPYTQIESGTPIFDGRTNRAFTVLTKEDYIQGKGGLSDGKTSVVFRLYDGTSIATGQQYLYVCKPIEQESAVGDQLSTMECDYYINQGKLKFTRDYGESWIEADITEDELTSTMDFYRDNLSLPIESLFISPDKALPIAYFYAKIPKLKILQTGAEAWKTLDFPTAADFGREITKRAVGFIDPSFGYAALGTDWSMGGGENKMCYFTADGGDTWTEKPLPMQGTSKALIDIYMADEKTGVVSLDGGSDVYFPLTFITENTGDEWTQIELPYTDLPREIQYLSDIVSFEYSDGKYSLALGQEDDGVYKAVFVSDSLTSGWRLTKTYKSTIHTVG
jgi:hypothetical protein